MEHQEVGMTMHMTVHWGWNISFVFEQFTVRDGQTGLLLLAMALTFAVSMLSVALPALKSSITGRLFHQKEERNLLLSDSDQDEQTKRDHVESKGQVLFNFFYILVYSVMQILSMMLIMTYNGNVIIAVIVGMTLGYTIFGVESDKDKSIPVNCCA